MERLHADARFRRGRSTVAPAVNKELDLHPLKQARAVAMIAANPFSFSFFLADDHPGRASEDAW